MKDVEDFLDKRKQTADEVVRLYDLVARYSQKMPILEARWDTTDQSIKFNNLDEDVVSAGLRIYWCSAEALWAGLYEPEIYDAHTLWSTLHDSLKIARVIENWEQNIALSPIYLVKHGRRELGLVADGKHRLVVSRAIRAKEVPFMVSNASEGWVSRALPTAECVFTSKR